MGGGRQQVGESDGEEVLRHHRTRKADGSRKERGVVFAGQLDKTTRCAYELGSFKVWRIKLLGIAYGVTRTTKGVPTGPGKHLCRIVDRLRLSIQYHETA